MSIPILRRLVAPLFALAVLIAGFATPALAQNNQQAAAQLAVQIQQLQEQVRTLTGQVEGLQFQLTQMQTLIEKMQADNELRFQDLEGAPPTGKPQAATESGGVTPTAELPQDQTAATVPADPGLAPVTDAPEAPVAATTDPLGAPMDTIEAPGDVGESLDPLVGTGETGAGTLGPLTLDPNAPASDPDAEAQYQAGYQAALNGDFAFAEDQFSQFVDLYPDDPHAPDATVLLGEAMIRRGAFDDAADVLTDGYTKYQTSPRAPEMLLRLGVALSGTGARDVACRTFVKVRTDYATSISAQFQERLAQEEAKAQCPPAG